jgi:hypothetical protein
VLRTQRVKERPVPPFLMRAAKETEAETSSPGSGPSSRPRLGSYMYISKSHEIRSDHDVDNAIRQVIPAPCCSATKSTFSKHLMTSRPLQDCLSVIYLAAAAQQSEIKGYNGRSSSYFFFQSSVGVSLEKMWRPAIFRIASEADKQTKTRGMSLLEHPCSRMQIHAKI